MTDSNATPTPWASFQFGTSDMGEQTGLGICQQGRSMNVLMGNGDALVCGFHGDTPKTNADARLIVQAVNSHQPMIDALEKTLHEVVATIRCVTDPETLREMQAVADEARQALTLAKGEAQ